MTLAPPQVEEQERPELLARAGAKTSWLTLAALASLGAGAIHFSAAGAHGDYEAAVLVFTALAVAQVGWGTLALAQRHRLIPLAGLALGVSAVVGWVVAKTVGLPFDGLDEVEPVTFADATAVALAAVATLAAAFAVRRARDLRLPVWIAVAVIGVATAAAAVSAPLHEHGEHAEHEADATHVHATPYDPALPIDLSGTPGVTPRQQAAAEQLVEVTLARLPRWSNATVAERAGFRSIGDGFTGIEHLINQRFLTDDVVLDPDRPESLVYDTTGGGRKLVAAMYMLKPGTSFTAVPDLGGALVQWHIHDNLCFTPSGLVRGITDASGACPAGLGKPLPAPMVHVWIVKNKCGPFAALEGIGGGRIAPGQTRLCDHVHGSTS